MTRDRIYGTAFNTADALAATLQNLTDGWSWTSHGYEGGYGFSSRESAVVDAVKKTGRDVSFRIVK